MSIPKEIDEGRLYRLVQAALKMRSLQKDKGVTVTATQKHDAEVVFDTLLDRFLKDIDNIRTDRVINKMNGF